MSNPDSRTLPDGWVTQFNDEHKVWFYINTKAPGGPASQWTHPADDAPPVHSYSAPSGAPPSSSNNYGGEKSSYNPQVTSSQPTYSEYDQARHNEKSYEYQQQPTQPSQPAYNSYNSGSALPPPPAKKGLGGFLDKLKAKAAAPHGQQQYGGYGQQQGMYGQQQGMYPQQGMYGQQQGMYGRPMGMGGGMMGGGMMGGRPQRQGMGAGGAAALGVGGGLLGGMMIGNMMSDNDGSYAEGYQDGGGGDDYGGDMGDMGGGDF